MSHIFLAHKWGAELTCGTSKWVHPPFFSTNGKQSQAANSKFTILKQKALGVRCEMRGSFQLETH